ncbi:MAG: tRNA (adenosine(37)-N6)-threonylcarbamoyltransferase complex ATPase subunit type 1 TsaE [Dehalococcoidales bacterium]
MSASKSTELRHVFLSGSPTATLRFGRRLGEKITAGSVIALIGELGCGKTLFTRGLCAGMGVPENEVNSPTFAFVNEYRGRLSIYHVDLYRINNIEDGFEIGMLDYLARAETGVIVLEWAEKILALLPEDYLQVKFEVLSLKRRRLELAVFGENSGALIRELED